MWRWNQDGRSRDVRSGAILFFTVFLTNSCSSSETQGFFFFFFLVVVFCCFVFVCLFRPALLAYGNSQARGVIGAVTADLFHSPSNARSEQCLGPTPQLTVMPDPSPTE